MGASLSGARLLLGTALFSLPGVAVLAALYAFGGLSPAAFLIGAAAVILGVGWLVRRALIELASVESFIGDLARHADATPPAARGAGADIAAAAARLRLAYAERTGRLEARAEAKATVLDYVPEPVILLDGAHRVIGANLAARMLLGMNVVGRSLATVLRDPAVLDAADAALKDAGARDVEFTLAAPTERVLCARIKTLPETLPDGTATIVALEDLTTVKRMDRMRGDFVANVSHELRTPLAALIGFIETLRGPASEDPAARARFLEIMHDQSARMARLVEDLMSLSRIEMHEHTPPTARVNVALIVQHVAEMLQIRAGKKSMSFKIDVPEQAPEVLGEADELTRVFQNLMENAVKYGHARTPIEIAIRREPEPSDPERSAIAVAVTDHGEGIPAEHLSRLTERFYRVDKARSRELGGTGLGLAIVKHIVNRHRGTLHVASTLGKGSTFTVRLPAAPMSQSGTG